MKLIETKGILLNGRPRKYRLNERDHIHLKNTKKKNARMLAPIFHLVQRQWQAELNPLER